MPRWVSKNSIILFFLLSLALPLVAHAATATYTSSTSTIEIPDNFTITDLDVTLNLDADIHALDINLISPTGTRLGLYTRNRAFGTRFRNTILDDEAGTFLNGSNGSWAGRFKPDASLSGLDGTSTQGTWTLELSYDSAFTTTLPIMLQNWSLTLQGADPATISGAKYHDQNGSGQRDSGEVGLLGWTVYLDTNNDAELDTGEPSTITDSEGNYRFENLDIKDYVVRELFQPTWFQVSPRSNQLDVRTLSGQIADSKDFGNILESETTASSYTSTTDVLIQDDGEAVRAKSIINVPDSFPVVDVNVTIDANAPLSDTRFSLIGPDGTQAMLFREGSTGVIGGSQFRSTTFDDQAPETVGSGDRPPFLDTYLPKKFLTALNQNSAGAWTLEALDTNPANGTAGEILGWTLELRTPIQADPEPVVIVPALMTSFNIKTIFQDEPGGTWRFVPGGDFYRGLRERLEEHGYIEEENLFTAHYDWRNPASDAAANYLKPIIDQAKQKTGADKVDIIAHSMGGIVSRSYIQGSSYENDIDQLILIGTPNEGAADAYVAWEGGDFPDRWDFLTRQYIRVVENVLKQERNIDLKRPLSFRTLFPSLKDLLPIQNFVIRSGDSVPVGQLQEKNLFLQQLEASLDLIDQRGVEVTTIAGSELATLNGVPLTSERTAEDIARERWRDGHPNPDPPTVDTTAGDQTVLLSSAQLGSTTLTLPNVIHTKLPEEAQEEIVETLGHEITGSHIAYAESDSVFGTIILSPVIPSVTDAAGNTFVCDSNKQTENFECIIDESDTNGPKWLTILNPAPGAYTIQLTGTGIGEYHAITCYADTDEDTCTTRQDTTAPEEVDTYQFAIGEDSFIPPSGDILALLQQLKDTAHRLLIDKHLKPKAQYLYGLSSSLADHGEEYAAAVENFGLTSPEAEELYQKIQADFAHFASELETQIQKGNLDISAILELTSIRDSLQEAGL